MVVLLVADGRRDEATTREAKLSGRRHAMARAQRQLTEIVAEAVCGHRRRFHALALEHLAERPDDRDLVTAGEIIQASTPRPIP